MTTHTRQRSERNGSSIILWEFEQLARLSRQQPELLGTQELELRDRFTKLGVPLRIGPADVAEAQPEADAIRSWCDEKKYITWTYTL